MSMPGTNLRLFLIYKDGRTHQTDYADPLTPYWKLCELWPYSQPCADSPRNRI